MARHATKALGNKFCQARLKAAECNEQLFTRAGAAELLPGVTEDCLKKYELDLTKVPNTVVALMADTYNAPELRAWYCSHECPLGGDCREIEEMPPERALIRVNNAVRNMAPAIETLEKIMSDGRINNDEADLIPTVEETLREVKHTVTEILAAIEKAKKTGVFS
ncbi:MAG: XRE family transcriptional regulator [Candidatus Ornithomonoglobus sp.]